MPLAEIQEHSSRVHTGITGNCIGRARQQVGTGHWAYASLPPEVQDSDWTIERFFGGKHSHFGESAMGREKKGRKS